MKIRFLIEDTSFNSVCERGEGVGLGGLRGRLEQSALLAALALHRVLVRRRHLRHAQLQSLHLPKGGVLVGGVHRYAISLLPQYYVEWCCCCWWW